MLSVLNNQGIKEKGFLNDVQRGSYFNLSTLRITLSLSRDVLVYFSDFIVWYVQPTAAVETLAPMYEMCIYHTINTANI